MITRATYKDWRVSGTCGPPTWTFRGLKNQSHGRKFQNLSVPAPQSVPHCNILPFFAPGFSPPSPLPFIVFRVSLTTSIMALCSFSYASSTSSSTGLSLRSGTISSAGKRVRTSITVFPTIFASFAHFYSFRVLYDVTAGELEYLSKSIRVNCRSTLKPGLQSDTFNNFSLNHTYLWRKLVFWLIFVRF